MENLTQILRFVNSKKPKILIEFPEEEGAEDNLTLTLSATLSPDIAKALNAPYVYIGETSLPEDGFKDIKLTAKLAHVDLTLSAADGELDTMSVESISKFKVTREENVSLGVQCEVEMTGNFIPILDFFRAHRNGFEFVVRSRQGSLFEDGTRVDMTGEKGEGTDADLQVAEAAEDLPGSIAPAPKRGRGRPPKAKPEPVTVN